MVKWRMRNEPVDFATLIGFFAAVGVILLAVLQNGNLGVIINLPSLLIVVAGGCGVVMMKFNLQQFFSAVKIATKTLFHKQHTISHLIKLIVNIATVARKDGILALEDIEIDHDFLRQAVQFLIDGVDSKVALQALENEMDQTLVRHSQGQQIFKSMGEVAPAMGMIGTLIGLVQLLSNMADPKTIGPAMAVAMLTTLYGAIVANMIAFPIADKLELRSHQEQQSMTLVIDAIEAIQHGHNPRVIEDMLQSYLPKKQRKAGDMLNEVNT